MAQTAAPYGLRPVKRADGLPYAGAVTEYDIDPAGYNTNIFNGSLVFINANGFIQICTATGADATTNALPAGASSLTGAIGVFVDAQGQLVNSQYYPANTVAPSGTRIKAYIVSDPDVLFQVQLDGTITQAALGANTFLAAAQTTSTGSTRTGNSTSAFESTVVTTTAAFRIVEFASPVSDAFPDVLVKFNPGYHSLTQAVGI